MWLLIFRCKNGTHVLRLDAGMHAQGAVCRHARSAWQGVAPLALDRWRFSPAAVLRSPHTQWWPTCVFNVDACDQLLIVISLLMPSMESSNHA
jgi:hypothetical protein